MSQWVLPGSQRVNGGWPEHRGAVVNECSYRGVGVAMQQGPSPQEQTRQAEQRRRLLALAQWQAQRRLALAQAQALQVELAQHEELPKRGSPNRAREPPSAGEQER